MKASQTLRFSITSSFFFFFIISPPHSLQFSGSMLHAWPETKKRLRGSLAEHLDSRPPKARVDKSPVTRSLLTNNVFSDTKEEPLFESTGPRDPRVYTFLTWLDKQPFPWRVLGLMFVLLSSEWMGHIISDPRLGSLFGTLFLHELNPKQHGGHHQPKTQIWPGQNSDLWSTI